MGAREPLARALVKGLVHSLKRDGHHRILARLQAEMDDSLTEPNPSPQQVASIYQRAAQLSYLAGTRGILLIIDELGKFLEYAALHPKDGDIFVLQELAEASARSGDTPLLMIGVLHQSAGAYARRIGRTHQLEWAKVGERFRELPFYPDDIEQLTLIG